MVLKCEFMRQKPETGSYRLTENTFACRETKI